MHGKREEREKREIILNFKLFCVINVKYEEISWRVRKKKGKKELLEAPRKLVLKKAYLTKMSKMNSRSIKHLLDSVNSNTSMIDLSKKITALVDHVKIKRKY